MKSPSIPKWRNYHWAGSAAIAALLVFFLYPRGGSSDIPYAAVQQGTFIVSLTETGELAATRSVTVTAPRVGNWSTRPQIVRLAPEGDVVRKGDFLAQFDTSALEKTIEQKQAELEIAEADLSRAEAANAAMIEDLEAGLANVQAAFELAQLQLDQMEFEAEVKKREQALQLERSKNDVRRAESKLESQRIINSEEEKKLILRMTQARAELSTAIREKESLTLTAPMDGLVVYPKFWAGGTRPKKTQEGDTPWPGQSIIELPDLSEIEALIEVTEVDVSKIETGMEAIVRLDAFPESLFAGTVSSVATLAKEKEEENPVKVFEVSVLLSRASPILRPGMTISAQIVIARIPDQRWIPIDAVFSEEDTTVVYRLERGKRREVPVSLGPKNEDYVVITSGLDVGDRVSLIRPGAEPEEQSEKKSRPSPPKKRVVQPDNSRGHRRG